MFSILKRSFGGDRHYYNFIWRIFRITASNIELYKLALIHRSASVVLSDRSVVNNERLEFLGDAVIETVTSEMLFIDYPEMNEGALTQLRSRIVSRLTLNSLALELGVDEQIIANPASINIHKQNIYGDAFEALIGALYLDKGYNCANRTLIKLFDKCLDIERMTQTEHDFKSRIIEWCQRYRKTVEFRSQIIETPGEMTPNFETTLYINSKVEGYGSGRSKKEAEQQAARQFYEEQIATNTADE